MATSTANEQDLIDSSLRALTTQELSVGVRKLESAFNIILTRVPSLTARLDASPTDIALRQLVIDTQVDMVLRFLNNPDGKYEESGDDYSFKRDSATSTGAVYMTDAEAALLAGPGLASNGAYTIRPSGWRY
jgi:hypothetical protein